MWIRRHLSYANVVATLALLFAMSGGALAAKHYLISSTGQINPKVLKKLKTTGPRGGTGATGPAGANGANGTNGSRGPTGEPGSAAGWAYVEKDGTINQKGGVVAIGIHKIGTGEYCIEMTPRQEYRAPILATVQGPDFTKAIVSVNTTVGSACNGITGLGVFTMNLKGEPEDAAFAVAVMADVPMP